jgi:EmrB/QacA subfamily drug resistance transporter
LVAESDAALVAYHSAPGRWIIAATVLGSGIAAIDATVVGIALPTLGRDFHTGVGALQWIVTAYTLTLSAFLLLGGSLGDRFGRRRVFQIGVAWFALASVACGLSPDALTLILMRALQGIGAALLTPGSLAIIQASFRPDDRGAAIGAWSGLGGLATAAGPFIGGYLIAVASWRYIFFINLPVAAAVLLVSARHVPESRESEISDHSDVRGTALAVVSLSGLTLAFIDGPSLGWGSAAVIFMLAAAALVAFVAIERRESAPMLPLSLFANRQFTATNAATFLVYAALSGTVFLLPVELQVVNHYSPLESGIALLPVTALMLLLSARSGRLAGRIGPRLQMSVGPIVTGAGLLFLTLAADGSNYLAHVFPAAVVFGLGLAITVAPLTTTAMGAAPAQHAGVASAVNNDVARIGGLIAVATLPALAGITGASYLHAGEMATGFRHAVLITGLACAAGGLLAAATIRNPGREGPTGVDRPGGNEEGCMHCALEATPLSPTRTTS